MKKIITFALSLLCISCISEYEAIEKLQTTPSAEYRGWLSTKSGLPQIDSLHIDASQFQLWQVFINKLNGNE